MKKVDIRILANFDGKNVSNCIVDGNLTDGEIPKFLEGAAEALKPESDEVKPKLAKAKEAETKAKGPLDEGNS